MERSREVLNEMLRVAKFKTRLRFSDLKDKLLNIDI